MKWKIDSNDTHTLTIGGFKIVIHRWVHEKDKWFLSLRNGPFDFDRLPLSSLDIESAKKEVINLLSEVSEKVQTTISLLTKREQKKIDSFKLRLVAILSDVENIHECQGNKVKELEPQFEKLFNTIKTAMSDL